MGVCGCYQPKPGGCMACNPGFMQEQYDRRRFDSSPRPPHGCICPPTAEKTCQGWNCPRRSASGMFQQAEQYAQGIAAQRGETPLGGSTAKPQEPDPSTARDAPKTYQREPTKLEQVARAMYCPSNIPEVSCQWDRLSASEREWFLIRTRACVAALKIVGGCFIDSIATNAIDAYLDSILTEKQGE